MLRNAGALLAGTAIALLLGELVVRQYGGVAPDRYYPRRLFARTPDPQLPYRLRPGARVGGPFPPVRINAHGLRGPELAPEPEGERILVLGDSVVYGHLVGPRETLPSQLQRALRERGRPAEVLNGGAPGYDTWTELHFLRRYGLGLSPDRLILGASLNDFDDAPRFTARGYLMAGPAAEEPRAWLDRHSELYTLVRWHWLRLERRHGWQRPGDGAWEALDRAIARQHKQYYRDPSGPGWERIARSLRELRDLARRRELPLLVAIFPESDQLAAASERVPQQRWTELCEQLDLVCLDLLPVFEAAGPGEALFRDVQHPNAAGLRVAAEALADAIAR